MSEDRAPSREEWLREVAAFLESDPEQLMNRPVDELEAELQAMGIDPDAPLPGWLEEILRLGAGESAASSDASDALASRRHKLQSLFSWVFQPATAFPDLQLVEVLGGEGETVGRGPGGKGISLHDLFDEEFLEEHAPWIGSKVEIGRQVVDDATGRARFLARVEVHPEPTGHLGRLRVILRSGGGEASEVELTSRSPVRVFGGEPLPADWEQLEIGLRLESSDDRAE